jgi:hypothetical protein
MVLLAAGCVLENWRDRRTDAEASAGILWIVAAFIGVFLLISLVSLSMASARDLDGRYANSPFHAWFESQYNSVGQWCCNEADGHAYYEDYKVNEDGSVTVTDSGKPVTIEAYKVLKGPNPTGHAVWWYVDGAYGRTTYCFIPGSMT